MQGYRVLGVGLAVVAGIHGTQGCAGEPDLTPGTASRFANLVLGCARREYPNKMDHIMNGTADVKSPRDLHPAFYGCFDWHSTVHGHWMVVRLLRAFPDLPEAPEIRRLLDENLAPERVKLEVDYFLQPGKGSFERTYGWAWLLKLAAELKGWDSPDAQRWSAQLQPLTDIVVKHFETFLPKQDYPIRVGTHGNTAFSLSLALDYARAAGDAPLEKLILERSRTYFLKDHAGPLAWEPSSEDFLSPCLEEASLMGKVLSPATFRPWLKAFLPGLTTKGALEPAIVSDRSDARIVHLDGLNLSRARALRALASTLSPGDPQRKNLEHLARIHAEAALPHVASGSYEGEHWLATFAVRLLERD